MIDRILRYIAVVPIVLATAILVMCFIVPGSAWGLAGIWLIVIAAPLNILAIIVTLFRIPFGRGENEKARPLKLTMALLLANYPTAFGYGWIGTRLMSTSKVTVVNNSGREIERASLSVRYQNDRELGRIPPGKKASGRVVAKRESSVILKYRVEATDRDCIAVGYVGRGISTSVMVKIDKALECRVSAVGMN